MRNFKNNILLAVFFISLTVLFTFPLILKMNAGIYGPFFTTDMRGAAWFLWWLKYAFLYHLPYQSCPLINAPDGALFTTPFFWVSFNFSRWLGILTNPVFSLNLALMIGFVLSGIFMYWLVKLLTKDKTAGLMSALIFAFSPYHLNKVMEFGSAFHGSWVALYCLGLFLLKNHPARPKIILTGAALGLTVDFNIYYGFFIAVFTLGFLFFCLFYQWKEKIRLILNKTAEARRVIKARAVQGLTFFAALFAAAIAGGIILAPSLIPLFKKVFSGSTAHALNIASDYTRSFDYLIAQSARPLSYLLPASTHPVFGGFTKAMFGSIFYGRGSIEQTLYLGWMPLILSFIAFRVWKKRRLDQKEYPGYASSDENFTIGFFIFSAWLAFVCSLPPYIDLGFFKIYLPSYYFYKILPMFRAYARFGIIVSLCVSVLAAYGLKYTLKKIKSGKIKILWTVFVFSAILFEFSNVPPWRVADLTNVPAVYSWLAREKGDFIVAEYPMAKAVPGEAPENYDYLYYQTIHQKRLVNGAPLNAEAAAIKEKIFKVDSPQTPAILKTLGIKYLILHSRLYKNGEYTLEGEIVGEIPQLEKVKGYKLVQAFGDDLVYEVIGEGE